MKVYPQIVIELDSGYRNSVQLAHLDMKADWNELKECLPLLEDWAEHIQECIDKGMLPKEYSDGAARGKEDNDTGC